MRILVFFDLPVESVEDRRNYRKFRKALIKHGFVMMQESVYSRLIPSPSVENSVRNMLETNKPPSGLVQSLVVTEKQFSKMSFIVGEGNSEYIDSDEKLVIL